MKYPHGSERVTGILVPLAALRSSTSTGCGEFADLPGLARWCAESGLKVIQLLPVNDTGGESSPYSALSAYALHPIYLRIQDLPEAANHTALRRDSIDPALDELRRDQEDKARFDYEALIPAKTNLLRTLFDELQEEICRDPALDRFITENAWVKPYAVFRALKDRYHQKAWTQWDDHREASPALLETLWDDPSLTQATRFYAWIQMRLAEQFRAASEAVAAAGVALKGDIPILMNEDSVDAWYNGAVFRPELRAGAPPDMFSELGQNWGFPIYNWSFLEENGFEWWRERLRRASQYYHAYRIDHVLGFFRIWAVPERNFSGILGFFYPQDGISREELYREGFTEERIKWLAEPHLSGESLRTALGDRLDDLIPSVFSRIGDEDLYLFSEDIRGEKDILALEHAHPAIDGEQRDWLLSQYRDRTLLELPEQTLAPTWTFRNCTRYRSMSQDEKNRFEAVLARHDKSSNELWAEHGRRLLQFMRETTDMLTCAEDLGVVPEAVPRVLAELDVLSLRIPRWSHYWDQPGQPLIPLGEYPEASVCAPSVHDTSTMRGWWEKEDGRDLLWDALGQEGPCPRTFDPATARAVYRGIAQCASRILVFQLQDLLALTPELVHADPDEERINIPGTSTRFNWTWRMPLTTEALRKHPVLGHEVQALVRMREPFNRTRPEGEVSQ